ncbi:hypothetical protein WG219_09840 [Ectopseudomonas mendocina]|uniref:Uncharacterized protein n=1 Tax=Ectopseudomonas mendocina TaxID=300 RepID=A0ABZ2RL54_ECTME
MTPAELHRNLFDAIPPAAMVKFSALNPGLEGTIKAGSMIVLSDPNNTSCTYQEAQLMQAAQKVKVALSTLTPDEANFMVRHRAEIASFTGQVSTWGGVSTATLGAHLDNLRGTLQAIETLHQDNYRLYGHLKAPEFFEERRRLLTQLDAHLLNSARVRAKTTLGDHPKLKSTLGISSQSLVYHWDKAGAPGQIPGYATHVDSIGRAAKYMSAGGYIAIGIGGISSGLAIQDVCSADPSSKACEKIKLTEGGKFVGSVAGGYLGGKLGIAASGPLCLALGLSTGLGGVACVAVVVGSGTWVGTSAGTGVGEFTGEKVYEVTSP